MAINGLYKLKAKDCEKLSALLTQCFLNYPLYCELIPDKAKREKILPEIFDYEIEAMIEDCDIYADSEDINGIIVVSDETQSYNPLKYFFSELFYSLKTDACLIKDDFSLKTLWNYKKGGAYLSDAWQSDINTDERLHIAYLAVKPDMQGKGIASVLMNAVLKSADERGLVTSLETHSGTNVSIYKRFGFKVFEVLQKHLALKQYCMVR